MGTIVTKSGSTQVIRASLPKAAPSDSMFIKKYWFGTARRRLRAMFRETFLGTSKARREYENLIRLREWGINVPAAVAYGEERRGGWLFRSFLISASVPLPMGLDTFISHKLPTFSSQEQRNRKRTIIQSLADQTRTMHSFRFIHHDFFWRNILLSGERLDRFFFIDAHKGRCSVSSRSLRARAVDLAALDAPSPFFFRRTERLRFLMCYLDETRLSAETKALAKLILKLAAPQRHRQLNRVKNCLRPE